MKKIYFPREVLPIAYTTSQFVNMLLSFLVIFAVVFFSGIRMEPTALLYLPVIMLIEYVLSLGITLLVSALTVYLRDMQQILGILSMAWMYMTPVVYSVEMIPEEYVRLFYLNPMTPVIVAYRDILYYGRVPEMGTLANAVILGIVILIIGEITFSRLQRGFAEEL